MAKRFVMKVFEKNICKKDNPHTLQACFKQCRIKGVSWNGPNFGNLIEKNGSYRSLYIDKYILISKREKRHSEKELIRVFPPSFPVWAELSLFLAGEYFRQCFRIQSISINISRNIFMNISVIHMNDGRIYPTPLLS